MASFQAKVGRKSPRKEENKNFRSISFLSEKLKNTIMASFQAKLSWEVREMEKIKIFAPFRSYPSHNRKFQKNSKKIVKIKKYH